MSDISFKYARLIGKESKHYKFYVVDESKFFQSIHAIENPSISKTDKSYLLELKDNQRDRFIVDTLGLINQNPLSEWTQEQLETVGIEKSDTVTNGGVS